ncbi:MAG: hypothetical protein U0931_05740 [Vulcanimicrobiota bacterium]
MHINNLTPKLATLVRTYQAQGDLGPNSQKGPLQEDQDYMTLMGMGMTTQLLRDIDNKEGVDFDPAPGKIRVTAESLGDLKLPTGDEMIGSYSVDEQAKQAQMQFESFGSEPMAVEYRMTANSAVIVALENKGETFQATALTFLPGSDTGSRVTRTGSWQELS